MTNNLENILDIEAIEVVYDGVIAALHNVSLSVPQGSVVALLGGNGAGKSTTLKSISTMLASERGKVTKGKIIYDGFEVKNQKPAEMVVKGLVQVLEGRRCFGHLTVEENIIAGAYSRKLSKVQIGDELEKIYNYFHRLKDLRKKQSGFTSGGEQQMIAVARAMMAKPKMLLLDEPSMGLAPQLVAEVFNIVKRLNESEGVSVLLAEQNTNIALRNADYGYIIETGHVMLHGKADSLLNNDEVKELYLGISKEGRKNFRDVLRQESERHTDLHMQLGQPENITRH